MDFLTIRMLDFSKPFIASPPHCRGGSAVWEEGRAVVQGRQSSDRAHHVAPRRLPLQALPDPEQRRPFAVDPRGLLEERSGHAGDVLGPGRRTRRKQRGELVPADDVVAEEAFVVEPVPYEHVHQRKGERSGAAVAAAITCGSATDSRFSRPLP